MFKNVEHYLEKAFNKLIKDTKIENKESFQNGHYYKSIDGFIELFGKTTLKINCDPHNTLYFSLNNKTLKAEKVSLYESPCTFPVVNAEIRENQVYERNLLREEALAIEMAMENSEEFTLNLNLETNNVFSIKNRKKKKPR